MAGPYIQPIIMSLNNVKQTSKLFFIKPVDGYAVGNINRFLYTVNSSNQRIEIGSGSRQCEWRSNRSGQPVGTSGARISYSLALEMNERIVKYGLTSLCIGGGQGIALLLEKP